MATEPGTTQVKTIEAAPLAAEAFALDVEKHDLAARGIDLQVGLAAA